MAASARKLVEVPEVVGLPFHVGRDLATEAGVTLANIDPDGPPIGALAWPGLFYISTQDPLPGVSVPEHDSVRVTVVEHGEAPRTSSREPANPPALDAHAEREPDPELLT
ncbi:PASTA domain-containing protein [Homoserinimonas sp. A447]